MTDPEEHRIARLPLAEHQPMTPAEAGLDLPPPPDRHRWRRGLIGGAIAAAVLVPLLLIYGGDSSTPLLELGLGECFTPVVNDLSTSVDKTDCEPGAVRLVERATSSAGADEPYPGEGALELFGQGACQSKVDADALVVAVPGPSDWADGERTVACTERL